MRLAICCCEDGPKWEGWSERLWRGLLEEPGDTFTTFSCFKDEFPDPATCRDRFDAIVVGGSHYSAYDELPWIRQLERLLPQYAAAGVRVVGCCFGHQVLAKALGGLVARNPSGRFVIGVESVSVDVAAARACGLELRRGVGSRQQREPEPAGEAPRGIGGPVEAALAPSLGVGPASTVTAAAAGGTAGLGASGCSGGEVRLRLRLLQSHGDQVLALPPGATLLASSATAAHEMWALGQRCLAFQFHPELTPDLVYDKIWTTVSSTGRLSSEEAAAAEAQLKRGPGEVDSDVVRQALQGFLRAPRPLPQRTTPAAAAAAAAASAAGAAETAASGGVHMAAEIRRALEAQAGGAAEAVLGHVREAAAAGMAAGTSSAELLTALNGEAAAAYGKAAMTVEGTAARLGAAVATQQLPLQAALASLGALEAQLDRLAAVVGSLEQESAVVEAEVQAKSGQGQAQAPGQPGGGAGPSGTSGSGSQKQ